MCKMYTRKVYNMKFSVKNCITKVLLGRTDDQSK